MAEKYSTTTRKEQVEQELLARAGQIDRRLAALQEEVTTIGPALRRAIFEHPLVSVGGALVAGLAVGLIFGGRKQPADPFGSKAAHRELVGRFVDVLVDEARFRVARGEEAGEAVRGALRDRVPLIVYEAGEGAPSHGFFAQALDILWKTALGFGVKLGIDYLTRNIDLPDFIEADQAAEPAPGAAPVAPPEAT